MTNAVTIAVLGAFPAHLSPAVSRPRRSYTGTKGDSLHLSASRGESGRPQRCSENWSQGPSVEDR